MIIMVTMKFKDSVKMKINQIIKKTEMIKKLLITLIKRPNPLMINKKSNNYQMYKQLKMPKNY